VPRAIAIETSGRIGSIATFDDSRGGVMEERTFPHGLQHAAQVLVIVDEMTRAAGWTPRDVQHVYVSIGPGSFTGLRIAATLAKTLALSIGVKIVAVPSVRVLVENAPHEASNVAIVLDAKRGQVFTASFRREKLAGPWVEVEPAHLDTLSAVIARSAAPLHLIGEGIPYHRDALALGKSLVITPEEAWRPRAGVVARLGAQAASAGHFADPLTLTPVYIRLAEAEEKWQAAQRQAAQ
jgi:tRNA threonylcarbamoyladenosine biosynthesis protein TsaB